MFDTLKVLNGTKLRKAVLATAGAAGLMLGAAMPAGAWQIGFEEFTDPGTYGSSQLGWIIDNEYSSTTAHGSPGEIPGTGIDATFSAYRNNGSSYESGYATLFDTSQTPASGGDTDLIAPFSSPNDPNVGSISPGHILVVHEANSECNSYASGRCKDPDDNANGAKIFIEFDEIVWLDSIDFFDINYGEEGGYIKLYANGVLEDTFYVPITGGDNTWAQVDFDGIGVDKIEIKLKGSGGIDNITGHLASTEVSEPGSIGLMAAGMVAFGAIRRRRNRKTN